MKKALLFSFLFFSVLLNAQELRAQDNTKYLIKAGKLFDSETGQFKIGMCILVNNTKIEAVKLEKDITIAEQKDYVLIDLSKYAVLPGLIDCHTHLLYKEPFFVPGPDYWSTLPSVKVLTMDGDAYRAIYGAARAKGYLEAGITSVQDLGNSGRYADMALQRAINEGLVPGPRMSCSGPGLSAAGGQILGLIDKHQNIVDDEYRVIKGVDDALQAVREHVTQGANVIKIYASNSPNRTMLSNSEIKAIVEEAHRYNIRVTAHATNNRAVYNAIVGGVDGIEHGYAINDTTLELMAKKGVILVPTYGDSLTTFQYAKLAYPDNTRIQGMITGSRKSSAELLKRVMNKGVTIAYGSDDYNNNKLPFGEGSKRTLIGYYEGGATIPQTLQFATINASKQINWSSSIGILKQGYLADIIAVDNDIDKNINAILNTHFVMKDGKIYVNK